jgi:hypothetical protein
MDAQDIFNIEAIKSLIFQARERLMPFSAASILVIWRWRITTGCEKVKTGAGDLEHCQMAQV